jgi:bifunctional ADP-heptose synthase (sugar kinase/adenylyltransferase)
VALGARVRLVGVVGDDECGATLVESLRLLGVGVDLVTVPGRRTAHKRRLITSGQLTARYDEEDHGEARVKFRWSAKTANAASASVGTIV